MHIAVGQGAVENLSFQAYVDFLATKYTSAGLTGVPTIKWSPSRCGGAISVPSSRKVTRSQPTRQPFLFNAAHCKSLAVHDRSEQEYYVRRAKANILDIDLLVLDFDGAMSIAEANERFQAFELRSRPVDFSAQGSIRLGQSDKPGLDLPACRSSAR